MLKILKCSRKVNCALKKSVLQRSFLTEAYQCENAWKSRTLDPILQKAVTENLILSLEHNRNTTGKVSALDMDILANTITQEHLLEQLLTLVYHLRMTVDTTNTLESTHHAIIRFLLDCGKMEDLVNVLHDRLNYGIFPNHMCYNLIMDTCLKMNDYATAAKIAVLPMLQEDSDNPITNALSIYCCHKFLEKPEDWPKPQVEEENSEEEIKVRIPYLKNPYFDDNFDLTDPRDLVGKTLAFHGKVLNNTLGRSCQLRGLILYKKYQNVLQLIAKWVTCLAEKNLPTTIVYKEVFDLIKKDTENLPEDQVTDELKNVMSQLETLKCTHSCTGDLMKHVEDNVKIAVAKQAKSDIAEQLQKYEDWKHVRKLTFDKQTEELNRQSRAQKLNKIKEDLQREERFITFFDKEDDIELQIAALKRQDEKKMQDALQIPKMKKKLDKLEKYGESALAAVLPPKTDK